MKQTQSQIASASTTNVGPSVLCVLHARDRRARRALKSTEMLARALACLTLHATPSVLPLRSSMMSGARTSFPTRTEMVTNGGNRSRVVSLAMEKPTEASGDNKKGRFFLPVVFTALSVACALALGRTMSLQPLYPFKTDSLSWLTAWLWMTIIDYYGATVPLCAIIFASERPVVAVLWSLACLLLGCPFCIIYVAVRALRFGSIRLQEK